MRSTPLGTVALSDPDRGYAETRAERCCAYHLNRATSSLDQKSLKAQRSTRSANATVPPQLLQGKTQAQIAAALSDTTSAIAKAIDGTANVNQAQGFLMARPLDPETLETQLLAPTRTTTTRT